MILKGSLKKQEKQEGKKQEELRVSGGGGSSGRLHRSWLEELRVSGSSGRVSKSSVVAAVATRECAHPVERTHTYAHIHTCAHINVVCVYVLCVCVGSDVVV